MASEKRNRHRRNRDFGADVAAGIVSATPAVVAAARTFAALLEESTAVKESIRGDLVRIDEATIRSDGSVPICIITPGWGSSGYYSAEVLEAAATARIWPAGTQMFADHPTVTERTDRPERSIRDLAAVLETDARWDPNGTEGPGLYGQARIFEAWRPVISELAPHIGVSVRAAAEVSNGVAEGRRGRIVENIVEGGSVDFVTRAGRGGKVLAILEAARVSETAMWADDVRQALRDALSARFLTDADSYLWVRDHNDTTVVFELSGAGDKSGTFQTGYTLDADGVATIDDGDPDKVVAHTTYTAIGEARTIGQWVESNIHLDFTRMCDEMAADGRLTREERITLSSAIGDALGAFVSSLEQAAPQLYQRDLYDEVPSPTTVPTEESMTKEEIQEAVDKAVEAKVAPLVQEATKELTTKLTEAETRASRAEGALLVTTAKTHISEKLGDDKLKGLPTPTRERLTESLSANPPATADGTLDVGKLDEAIATAVKAEVEYLVKAGVGSTITGVGESVDTTATSVTEADANRLESALQRLGASESAAKTAAAGRGR